MTKTEGLVCIQKFGSSSENMESGGLGSSYNVDKALVLVGFE
jgi:hypothetical protein